MHPHLILFFFVSHTRAHTYTHTHTHSLSLSLSLSLSHSLSPDFLFFAVSSTTSSFIHTPLCYPAIAQLHAAHEGLGRGVGRLSIHSNSHCALAIRQVAAGSWCALCGGNFKVACVFLMNQEPYKKRYMQTSAYGVKQQYHAEEKGCFNVFDLFQKGERESVCVCVCRCVRVCGKRKKK